jgi:hypothetical protein
MTPDARLIEALEVFDRADIALEAGCEQLPSQGARATSRQREALYADYETAAVAVLAAYRAATK